jgi:hypothetical protein
VLLLLLLLVLVSVFDDCVDEAPWLLVELALVLDDCWFALVLLFTLCEPLPTFTPGLTLAEAFTGELLTSTLAFTPTLGSTLMLRLELVEDDGVPDAVPELVAPFAVPAVLLPLLIVVDCEVPLALSDELEPFTTPLALAVPPGLVAEPAMPAPVSLPYTRSVLLVP